MALSRIILVLLSCSLATIVTSCDESNAPLLENSEEVWEDPLKGLTDRGKISFTNPLVGQRSSYLEFEEVYDQVTGTTTTTYTGDTLIVGIANVNGATLELIEHYSRFSTRRVVEHDSIDLSHLTVLTTLTIGDSLFILPEGFYSYVFMLNRYLPLTEKRDTLTEHTTTIPVYDLTTDQWTAQVNSYQVGENQFNGLIAYFDYTDIATDGVGLSVLYSKTYGVVRSAFINPWESSRSEGWDLLFE